jgi:hypothetical protein
MAKTASARAREDWTTNAGPAISALQIAGFAKLLAPGCKASKKAV